jgi:hypothetical protein
VRIGNGEFDALRILDRPAIPIVPPDQWISQVRPPGSALASGAAVGSLPRFTFSRSKRLVSNTTRVCGELLASRDLNLTGGTETMDL